MRRRLITPPSEWGAFRRSIGVWLAIVFFFGGPSAFAVTYTVNPVSGSDSNPSPGPFKTLTHALSVAVSGDVINAAAGVYTSLTGEVFPLHLVDGVAVHGAGIGTSFIDGKAAVSGGTDNALFENSGTNLGPLTELSGFTLTNATTLFDQDVMFFDVGGNSMSPKIDNNEFPGVLATADGIKVRWNGG